MDNDKPTKSKRFGFLSAGGLMMLSALLYWLCDMGVVFAACLAAAGLCFLSAGLNEKDEEKKD